MSASILQYIIVEDLPSRYGPLVLGVFCSSSLAGLFYHQAFLYWRKFGDDRWFYKLIVAGMLVISLLAYAANIAICWFSFVVGPYRLIHNPSKFLPKAPWYFVVPIAAPGAASVLSQIFFIDRAHKMSDHNLRLTLVLLFFCFVSAGMWISTTIMGAMQEFRPAQSGSMGPMMTHITAASLWTSATVDLILTIALVWIIKATQSGFNPRTDSILRYCLRLSVTTGAITSLSATVSAIAIVASVPADNNGYLFFALCLPHVTCAVVTGTLNAREARRLEHASLRTGSARATSSDETHQQSISSILRKHSISVPRSPDGSVTHRSPLQLVPELPKLAAWPTTSEQGRDPANDRPEGNAPRASMPSLSGSVTRFAPPWGPTVREDEERRSSRSKTSDTMVIMMERHGLQPNGYPSREV